MVDSNNSLHTKVWGFLWYKSKRMINLGKEWRWMDYWTMNTTEIEMTWTQTSTHLIEDNNTKQ